MDFIDAAQIKECQNPIPLWTYEYRIKAGENQVLCSACSRWQFEKDQCIFFQPVIDSEK